MNAKSRFSVLCTVTAMLIAAHCAAQTPAVVPSSARVVSGVDTLFI